MCARALVLKKSHTAQKADQWLGGGGRDGKDFFGVMNMFAMLVVVMASCVYTCHNSNHTLSKCAVCLAGVALWLSIDL